MESSLAVVPVLIGPLQVLIPILAGALLTLASGAFALCKPSAFKSTLKLLWRQKLPLLVIVACVLGGLWGTRRFAAARGPVSAAEGAGNDWPLARGGATRLGSLPGARGPTSGGVNWVHKDGDEAFFSSPAVCGKRVYVASGTLGVLSESGRIYCLDADTGAVVWSNAPSSYRPTFSSPVVCGRYVVCGEGLHVTRDGRLVCLDANDGTVLWTLRTNSHVECTPVIHNGRAYVGAGDDGYYCVALEPLPGNKPNVVWHLPGENYPDAETSLLVHDGRVYAGLGNGGHALCVLDAETGKEIRRLDMSYPVFSPASVADGKLYLAMGNGDYVHSAEELRATALAKLRGEGKSEAEISAASAALAPGGEVRCLDLQTLETKWTYPLPATVLGAIAVAGDQLFFGAQDGHVYCLSTAGKLIAKWNAHAPIIASVAVTEQHVYAVTAAGTLFALERGSLKPVWECALGSKPLFISSPAIAHGRAYMGTQFDGFLCVGESSAKKEQPIWAGHLGGAGRAGNVDGSPLPSRSAFQWQFPADQTGESKTACVQAPPAALGEHLCVPLASGKDLGIACLRVAASTAQTPKPLWLHKTANSVLMSPAMVGDAVLFVDGKPGDPERRLHSVRISDGTLLWQAPVESAASGVFTVAARAVFIQAREQELACFDLAGNLQWSRRIGALACAPTADGAIVVAALAQPAALLALDAPSGLPLWGVSLPAAATSAPAIRRGVLYLGTSAGLEARALTNGALARGWKTEGGAVTGDFALRDHDAVYVNAQKELVIANLADGSILRRVPGAIPGHAPLVSRQAILFHADGKLLYVQDGDAQPQLWTDSSWLGAPVTSFILHDSCVYGAMAGWGLVRFGKPTE
jgi:outer membrane protein assembly factor BamB